MKFDRKIYFDSVRASLFGSMSQQQVDGQEALLGVWEAYIPSGPDSSIRLDLRWLAYVLATTYHETAATMWPIKEYGNPTCGGAEYAKENPPGSGNRFYGRGFCQLTWADNYKRATKELGLSGEWDLYQHPDQALDPGIAARVIYLGMYEGWFRSPHTLSKYFNESTDDPFNAREIVNGDKNYLRDGVKIGTLIAGYHQKFLTALDLASEPESDIPEPEIVRIGVSLPKGVEIELSVHGEVVYSSNLEG